MLVTIYFSHVYLIKYGPYFLCSPYFAVTSKSAKHENLENISHIVLETMQ